MKLDRELLLTAIGGLTGAAAVDSEGDFFAAPVGAAIGATAANYLDIKTIDPGRLIQNNRTLQLSQDKRLTRAEQLRESLTELYGAGGNTPVHQYASQVLSNSSATEYDLSVALTQLKSTGELSMLTNPQVKSERLSVTKVAPNASDSVKLAAFENKLKSLGYTGKNLTDKLALFEPLISNSKGLIINGDSITLGEQGTIRLTDSLGGNITNGSYYATQRLNPFAKAAADGMNVKSMAEAVGINLIDAANSDVLRETLERGFKQGLRPDDMQAMLAQSDLGLSSKVQNFAETAYQYSEDGTSALVKNSATARSELSEIGINKRILNESDYGVALNIDTRTNGLNTKNPFKRLNTNSPDGVRISDYLKTRNYLTAQNGGFIQEGVKTDKYTVMSTAKPKPLANAMGMIERNAYTTGTRGDLPGINKASLPAGVNATADSEVLTAMSKLGLMPEEFRGSVPLKRITVDAEQFNAVADRLGLPADVRLGDGSALGSRTLLNQFEHKETQRFIIPKNSKGEYAVSSAVQTFIDSKLSEGVGFTGLMTIPNLDERSKDLERIKKLEVGYTPEDIAVLKTNVENSQQARKKVKDLFVNGLPKTISAEESEFIKNAPIAIAFDQEKFNATVRSRFSGQGTITPDILDTLEQHLRKGVALPDLGLQGKGARKLRQAIAEYKQDSDLTNLKNYHKSKIMSNVDYNDASAVLKGAENGTLPQVTTEQLAKAKQQVQNYYARMLQLTSRKSDVQHKEYSTGMYNKLTAIMGEDVVDTSKVMELFQEHNRVAAVQPLANHEVLGLDAKGSPIKVSTEFNKWRFTGAREVTDDFGVTSLELNLEGYSRVGSQARVKSFGVSSKQAVGMLNQDMFDVAYAVADQLERGLIPAEGTLVDPQALTTDEKLIRLLSGFPVPPDKTDGELLGESILDRTTKYNLMVGKNTSIIVDASDTQASLVKTLQNDLKAGTLTTGINKGLNEAAISSVASQTFDSSSAARLVSALSQNKDGAGVLHSAYYDAARVAYNSGKYNTTAGASSRMLDFYTNIGFSPVGHANGEASLAAFGQAYHEHVGKYFNGSAGFNSVDMFNNPAIQSFFNATNETYHWSSLDSRATYTYGARSGDRGMSWNAQKNLINSGYAPEVLDLFGTHDANAVYDLKAFSNTMKKSDSTINSFIADLPQGKFTELMQDLRAAKHEDYADIFTKHGANRELVQGDFISYALPANEFGIETLPLYKQSTYRVGTYVTPEGQEMRKNLSTLPLQIIRASEAAARDPSELMRERHLKVYQDLLTEYTSEISNTIQNSSGNILKESTKRYVENSSYSIVAPAEGHIKDLAIEYNLTGKGLPTVGVSEEGAVERLRLFGVDTEHKDFNLENHMDADGRLLDADGNKVFSIQSREPAFSTNSTRLVNYTVIPDAETATKNTVFHSAADTHYSKLMFGDFDFDHVFEYFPKRNLSAEEYANILAIGENQAKLSRSSIELAQHLGVKGSAKDMKSLSDFLDEASKSGATGTELNTVAAELYAQHLEGSAVKAGQRKSLTPTITNFANSIFKSVEKASSPGTQLFNDQATLMHYLVENMIKSQHTKTGAQNNSVSEVEKLVSAREKFLKNPSAYGAQYTDALDQLLHSFSGDMNDSLKARVTSAVDGIKQAEMIHAPSLAGSVQLPTDFGRAVAATAGEFSDIVEKLDDFVHHAKILPVDEGAVNIARTASFGYDEIMSNIKTNVANNKVVLALAAAGLVGTSIITQKSPDFKTNTKATANPSSMMMAPSKQTYKDRKEQDTLNGFNYQTQSNYLTNKDFVKQAVSVQGQYTKAKSELDNSIKRSVFGNNISNVRIESYYE
jgi:hypothetical protein